MIKETIAGKSGRVQPIPTPQISAGERHYYSLDEQIVVDV
jgi:hypothetical protein